MGFLVIFNWSWLLLSELLGFVLGWFVVVLRGRGVSKRTSQWLALLAVAVVAAALAHLIPGRPGYWLDLALLMFAMYILGCAVGSWLRERVLSRGTPTT